MADPLSLATGIAGLLSLTIQVLHIVNRFKGNVGTVCSDVEALVQELIGLQGILEKLRTAWKERKLGPEFEVSALRGLETACEKQLTTLLDRLNKASGWLQRYGKPIISLRGTAFRLYWPFEVEKTREVVDNLY